MLRYTLPYVRLTLPNTLYHFSEQKESTAVFQEEEPERVRGRGRGEGSMSGDGGLAGRVYRGSNDRSLRPGRWPSELLSPASRCLTGRSPSLPLLTHTPKRSTYISCGPNDAPSGATSEASKANDTPRGATTEPGAATDASR